MSALPYISSETVEELLDWDSLLNVLEKALIDVSKKDGSVIVPPRIAMTIPDVEGHFFNMPAYSKAEQALGTKLVTAFKNNVRYNIPSHFATIILLDPTTGRPIVAVDGTQITGWRTAGVSAVATKHMCKDKAKDTLAIIGAGVQAETHALVFQHLLRFKEVRLWNRTKENAVKLATRLPFKVTVADSLEECCRDADVICTTTYASQPLLKAAFLKPGVHINAVGFCGNHYSELEEEIYQTAYMTVEHSDSAEVELRGILDRGVVIQCEIGEFIRREQSLPQGTRISLFQSTGLAVEDVTAANLVYKKYLHKQHGSH